MTGKGARGIFILALLIFMSASVSGCNNTASDFADKAKNAQPKTVEETDTDDTDASESDKGSDAGSSEDEWTTIGNSEDFYREDPDEVFAEMSDWMFIFSSGAGGWETNLFVEPDGSFKGRYYDSDMGSTGPGYSDGTLYECNFSGRFSREVRSAGPLMHSLKIESIEYDHKVNDEEIIDNVLHVYSGAYGIEGLEKVTAYEPLVYLEAGAVTSVLNEEEMSWVSPMHFGTHVGEKWDYVEDVPEQLPYAVLLNTVDNYAFYTESNSGKNKTFLVNKAKLPGLHNTECTIKDDGTYYCVDENDDSSFRIISTCFKATKEYDAYSDPETLVNDSVKRILGAKAPDPKDIYITSPKDAYEMSYPCMSVCGYHSDYAFWYPDKDSYDSCIEGRFLVVSGYETDASFVYAYIIENSGSNEHYPDAAFSGRYISSLTLTGKSDDLSSAAKGRGAVRSILTTMKTPENGKVSAKELIMVSDTDTDLIKKYHLENANFDDDYEMVSPDNTYHEYMLDDGDNTPFYIQYPEDKIHSLRTAYDLKEVMGEPSDDTSKLMQLYLNKYGDIVYGYEVYTP